MEEVSVSFQDEFTTLRQLHADLGGAKADKGEMKKVAKQMAGLTTRFRDWHEHIRQANTKANEVEAKLAEYVKRTHFHSPTSPPSLPGFSVGEI